MAEFSEIRWSWESSKEHAARVEREENARRRQEVWERAKLAELIAKYGVVPNPEETPRPAVDGPGTSTPTP